MRFFSAAFLIIQPSFMRHSLFMLSLLKKRNIRRLKKKSNLQYKLKCNQPEKNV